ncbi:MAG UNVERIFIED_CONTAM: hypothetical protein LVR29_18450 [Microcystis novacekii LVE1205-3]
MNQMFEVMGARATSSSYGFDRYWRNLRTFTLHDPVDYKIRESGQFGLSMKISGTEFLFLITLVLRYLVWFDRGA